MASTTRLFIALVFFGALAIFVAEGILVPFTNCGSPLSGAAFTMDFDCNGDSGTTSIPCKFTKGHEYHGEISVTPNAAINNSTILFHAIIDGVPLPFTIPDNNMCEGHNVTCPLNADEGYVVAVTLTVPSYAPSLNIISKIELQTLEGHDLLCAKFFTTIVAESSSNSDSENSILN